MSHSHKSARNVKKFYQKLGLLASLVMLSTSLLVACGSEELPPNPGTTGAGSTTSAVTVTPVITFANDTATATPTPIQGIRIAIDQTKVLHTISPYIYGLAGTDGTPEYDQQLKIPYARWGGNPSSRYNWVIGNAWNTGRDGGFHNTNYENEADPDTLRNVAEESVESSKKLGQAFLFTIPTIGWVAKDSVTTSFSYQVPDRGAVPEQPGSDKIVGYDPTANRQRTSVQSKAKKGAPFVLQPNPDSPVIYQDEFVARLVKKYGKAADGGVKFYAMDNEPELWSQTHTDVHPARVGYDEILSKFLEYADAIKAVDPTAQITGPVSNGWNAYFYSELDRGSDNFLTAADRKAHNNMPFLAWFLSEVKKYDDKVGYRTLDVLDIHYYPQGQGVFDGDTGADANTLRLNSVRSLWDPTYVDESWIADRVRLIPRMQELINQYYPGTKLAINEWDFGADKTLNGGLAIANTLGVYARYDLYMAAYWRYPDPTGAGFQAFKMYTNLDGKGTRFGDQSIEAKSSIPAQVSSYAAIDSKTGRMQLMLINNRPDRDVTVELQLTKDLPQQDARLFELGPATNERLAERSAVKVVGSKISVNIPAYTAIMLDMQP
jgi:hypothetical protein